LLTVDGNTCITDIEELLFLLSYARKIEIQQAGRVSFQAVLRENPPILEV
jgi:hypothetical protein